MPNDFDRDLKSAQRRRLLQGAAALPLAGLPLLGRAANLPTAQINTTRNGSFFTCNASSNISCMCVSLDLRRCLARTPASQ